MKNWLDISFTFRVFKKRPLYSALCVIIVTLGVGIANVALTVAYNALVKPLPYPYQSQWTYLSLFDTREKLSWGGDAVDAYQFQYIRDNTDLFSTLGAISIYGFSRLNNGDDTLRITSAEITPNLFQAAGVQAHLGRVLVPDDSEPGSENAVAISYTLWQNAFGSDSNIIGRRVEINETGYTVIGVMAEETYFGVKHDLWLPQPARQLSGPFEEDRRITPVGILKPGVTLAEATSQLNKLRGQLNESYPELYGEALTLKPIPFRRLGSENDLPIYLAVFAITIIIVLLSGLNIGNLIIARTVERQQEFAVRSAMGASTLRMLKYFLLDSFYMCLAGALIGIAVGSVFLKLINNYLLSTTAVNPYNGIPAHWHIGFDWVLVCISLLVIGFIWAVTSLVPYWRFRRLETNAILNGHSKGSSNPASLRFTRYVVGIEVIASCFLLVVSGALLMSIMAIANMDYGIREENRVIAEIDLPADYRESPDRSVNLIRNLVTVFNDRGDDKQVALSTGIPNAINGTNFSLSDRDVSVDKQLPVIRVAAISDYFFDLMQIPLLAGRGFNASDSASTLPTAIVDQRFAETMWPGESVLGKTVILDPLRNPKTITIVGVAANVVPRVAFANVSRESIVYLNLFQSKPENLIIVAASDTTLANTFTSLQNDVRSIDPTLAVHSPRTMSQHLLATSSGMLVLGNFFIVIGIATFALAIIGIFAIVARSVAQQTKDIGVRKALGSSDLKVLAIYCRQGFVYLLCGAIVGGIPAVAVNNVLSSFFDNLMATTPWILLCVCLALGLLIIVACIVPAQKAVAMEPGEALYQM